jgi:hypothetical protein
MINHLLAFSLFEDLIKKRGHAIQAGFIYHYGYFNQVMIIPLKALFTSTFIFLYAQFYTTSRSVFVHTTLLITDNTVIK